MRKTLRNALLAASTLGFAAVAMAQTPMIGSVTDPACAARDIRTNMGEVYAVKVAPTGANSDWLMDASAKGGPVIGIGGGDISGNTFQVPGNWSVAEAGSHVGFTFVTFPDGTLYVDSGPMAVGVNFMGSAAALPVGNTPDGNVSLPGAGGQYSIDMGSGATSFPAATALGINVAIGAHPDFSNVDQGGCTWGGELADPQSAGRGLIVGYNVYRMASATQPTRAQLGTVANWVYMMPYDYNLAIADDTAGTMPGTPAASDPAPNNLAGLQNLDGVPYSGDEVMLFQDTPQNPDGSARLAGTAPAIDGTVYWYGFQPVVRGAVSDFTNASIAGGAPMDYRVDLDSNGTFDAVNFGGGGADGPEFISPQANAGQAGLGLTVGGLPLMTAILEAGTTNLPAFGNVRLQAFQRDNEVALSLSSDLEAGNVLGYNVYRVAGESRHRVNDEIIQASGNSGSVYELVDERFGSARRTRGGNVEYSVEIVYNDGTPSRTVGPFALEGTERSSTRRR